MNHYTVRNLSIISRLAVLENANRTGQAINDLVSILRYLDRVGDTISTLKTELEIVEKMFSLHQLKKGGGFSGIIHNELHQDKCYISKGLLVLLCEVAIDKNINRNKTSLEVIISVTRKEDHVVIIIKDDGQTEKNEHEELLEQKYMEIQEIYKDSSESLVVSQKPNIGTQVKIVIMN